MSETWTIRKVVEWTAKDFAARGLPAPRLDAELLVAHALGLDRVKLYMDLDRPLDDEELARSRALVGRRRKHEPVAYILGVREFYGRAFEVSPAVLVPRPDTETLVDAALERLPKDSEARVLDLGTGTGILGITLAKERPALRADLVDVSEDALAIAKRNVDKHEVADRVRCLLGDLFAPVRGEQYAMIVSNPPYIVDADIATLMPDVSRFEPRLALAGGPDGLAFYRRIAREAKDVLVPGGWVLVEVGETQAADVMALFEGENAYDVVASARDLARIERVVSARLRATTP